MARTRKPHSKETRTKISLARKAGEALKKQQLSSLNDPTRLVIPLLTTSRTEVALRRDFFGLTPEIVRSALDSTDNGVMRDWADFCHNLRSHDATIATAVQTRINGVASHKLMIVPKKQEWEKVSDFIADILDNVPLLSFSLRHLLFALFSGAEIAVIDWTFDETDKIWKIAKIDPRDLRNFSLDNQMKWFIDNALDEDNGLYLEQDPNRWIVFEPGEFSQFPNEAGLFRAAAMWSYMRRQGMAYWAEGLARNAFPGMALTLPAHADDKEMNSAKQGLDNYEYSQGIVLKAPSTIETIGGNASGGSNDFFNFTNAFKRELIQLILGGYLTVDGGANSNFGTGEIHQQQKIDLAIGDAERLIQTLKQQLIKPIIELNKEHVISLLPDSEKGKLQSDSFTLPLEIYFDGLDETFGEIQQWHVEYGLVSFNEARRNLGLPKWKDGNVKIPSIKLAQLELTRAEATNAEANAENALASAMATSETTKDSINEQNQNKSVSVPSVDKVDTKTVDIVDKSESETTSVEQETEQLAEQQDVVIEEKKDIFEEAVGADFPGILVDKIIDLAVKVSNGSMPLEGAIRIAVLSFPSRTRKQIEETFEPFIGFKPSIVDELGNPIDSTLQVEEQTSIENQELIKHTIKKETKDGSQVWCVYSSDGSKSFGCYPTEGEAKERLKQIEFFKDKE